MISAVCCVVLPSLFALVEDLEEEHPSELADPLSVAVDAVVFTHDVLNGLDGATEIHSCVYAA